MTTHKKAVTEVELERLIKTAMDKLGVNKESALCRYIPSPTGGYVHHFTLRKMKTVNPEQLACWIEDHILKADKPRNVAPKQRAARGSRKPRHQMLFSKNDIERLLKLAILSNDKEIIRKLSPQKDLKSIKRELLASIRHNRVEQDLWTTYSELVNAISHSNNSAQLQPVGADSGYGRGLNGADF